MARLERKIALVTGAGSGLGKAIALRFALEGADVILADISSESAGLTLTELARPGRVVLLDVGDDTAWRQVAQDVSSHEGRLDVLVNCAGISVTDNAANVETSVWERVFRVNCHSVMLGTKHFLPLLRRSQAPAGSIVNIASAAGLKPQPEYLSYGTTKAAVIYMTQSIALYCATARLNVRCNAICPGVTETPIFYPYYETMGGREAALKLFADAHVPIGRVGQPQEIAGMATYLASDEADFVTGSIMSIDGGQAIK